MIAEPIAGLLAGGIAGPLATGAGAFLPSDVPGLLAWYDASDAASFTYSSGTNVQTWADKSGGGRTMTYFSGVGSRPTRGATDWSATKPGVTFVDGFFSTAAAINQYCAGFVVCKPTTLAGSYRGVMSDTNWMLLSFDVGTGHWGSYPVPASSSLSTGTKYLLEMSGGASGTFYLNGTSDGAYPGTTGSGLAALRLGANQTTDLFVGIIAEALCYDPATMTDAYRAQIRSYLNSKWGIY